ncbi:hypothetical protein BH09ACT3_BH09ACT3_03530 [soil metagenome]
MLGILGELLITGGVLVLLFLGWQLWLNDLIVGADQNKAGIALAQGWDLGTPSPEPEEDAGGTGDVGDPGDAGDPGDVGDLVDFGDPVVSTAPANATQFAVMYVPRFGADYSRSVSEGVGSRDVLDKNGIGHYPGTQMPGEVGNFAVAAHRTTHGAPFNQIATLRVGDRIYVQTEDGFYTYLFRGLEYVRPTGVGVLDPVPQSPGTTPTDRVLTLTSCNPMFSAAERIIAYAALDSWQPTSAGAPEEILATVTAKG